MISWKQFWCHHIYKVTHQQALSTTFDTFYGIVLHTSHNYAVYSTCIKCGKQIIKKQAVDVSSQYDSEGKKRI